MELLLLQFHWALVYLRMSGLRTKGLSGMQPEGPHIEGKGLGGSEILSSCSQRPERSDIRYRPSGPGQPHASFSAIRVPMMTKQQYTYEDLFRSLN